MNLEDIAKGWIQPQKHHEYPLKIGARFITNPPDWYNEDWNVIQGRIQHQLYRTVAPELVEVLKDDVTFVITKRLYEAPRMDPFEGVTFAIVLYVNEIALAPGFEKLRLYRPPDFSAMPANTIHDEKPLVVWFCHYCESANLFPLLTCQHCGHPMTEESRTRRI